MKNGHLTKKIHAKGDRLNWTPKSRAAATRLDSKAIKGTMVSGKATTNTKPLPGKLIA